MRADRRIQLLVDELSHYDEDAGRDARREKIREIESERNMLSEEGERLAKELEQYGISPDFEKQIKGTAEAFTGKLSGWTIADKRMVLDALELRAQYYYDPERGDILNISCAIPYVEDEIVFNPSRKSLHNSPVFSDNRAC